MALYRVLVADSCKNRSQELQASFVRSGAFSTMISTNKDMSVVELVEFHRPDVVILDMTAPGQDGISILDALHQLDFSPVVIVKLLYSAPRLTAALVSLGASYLIATPHDSDAVVAHAIDILEKRRVSASDADSSECKDLSALAMKLLREIGIPLHMSGYGYLLSAVTMTIRKPELLKRVTKELYPAIAKEYNSTASRIERSMRTAVRSSWNRGSQLLTNFFQWGSDGVSCPSNSRFITVVLKKIQDLANDDILNHISTP